MTDRFSGKSFSDPQSAEIKASQAKARKFTEKKDPDEQERLRNQQTYPSSTQKVLSISKSSTSPLSFAKAVTTLSTEF